MAARQTPDSENLKATPRFRVDGAELQPPQPHAFDLPAAADIKKLSLWLNQEDVTLQEFGEKLARYQGLTRYVCAVATHRGRRREAFIRDPVHAAAFLGINGLKNILLPLASEHSSSTTQLH